MFASLSQLLARFRALGANRIYAKKLAPNDNSKNQVYLGGDFSVLNVIPHGEIYTDSEAQAGSKRDRAKARVNFFWITPNGQFHAPDTNLILYPKYPEVRISGFLKGCESPPSEVMTIRDSGRVLVIGITDGGDVLGHAALAEAPAAKEVNDGEWHQLGVFQELPVDPSSSISPKQTLLAELKRVYEQNWIMSQKLARDGIKAPYSARNGGGYTLEAELGITPNGYSEPDFMGWEVKQYGVSDFVKFRPKSPVTLLTPEPTGGIYYDQGVAAFLRLYGYPDKSGKPNRLNFGGIYINGGDFHADTGLQVALTGFDVATGKITDIESGSISLLDRRGEVAAKWSIKNMMDHWQRKHAQAAYVPSLFREPPPEYSYGPRVLLCEQTDFILFLKAFANGNVYYDPAVKLVESNSAGSNIKRRSQFRIKHQKITILYYQNEVIKL